MTRLLRGVTSGKHHTQGAQWPLALQRLATLASRWEAGCTRGSLGAAGRRPAPPCSLLGLPSRQSPHGEALTEGAAPSGFPRCSRDSRTLPAWLPAHAALSCPAPPPPQLHIRTRSPSPSGRGRRGRCAGKPDALCAPRRSWPHASPACRPVTAAACCTHTGEQNIPQEGPLDAPLEEAGCLRLLL